MNDCLELAAGLVFLVAVIFFALFVRSKNNDKARYGSALPGYPDLSANQDRTARNTGTCSRVCDGGDPMTIQEAAQTELGVQDALRIALRTSYVL